MCLQGLSVTELEAQMLSHGSFGQQQPQTAAHQQSGVPQPGQRPPQNPYSQGSSSGLYSPSAAAALARLTQSAQQGHQAQPSLGGSPNPQRLSPLLQSSMLATQMQQRQGRPPGPAYAARPGKQQFGSTALEPNLCPLPAEKISQCVSSPPVTATCIPSSIRTCGR